MTKLYLRDNDSLLWTSYHFPFCSTLTKEAADIDYYSLISDKDIWFKILCNDIIQHFHLGLFFLGSVSNVITTYFMIDELLDDDNDHDHDHDQQQRQLRRNFRNQTKKIILWGSFGMIIGFWLHYSLTAFKVVTIQVTVYIYILVNMIYITVYIVRNIFTLLF